METKAPIKRPIIAPTGVEPKKAKKYPRSSGNIKGSKIVLNHTVSTEDWKARKSQ